ncbi:hypothetical protein EDB89DRAFT_591403 [Lactarius sanguifluus]|nr:hypothetical protein EDB89DRAFT_591403 [Lactarius sanguifluus]
MAGHILTIHNGILAILLPTHRPPLPPLPLLPYRWPTRCALAASSIDPLSFGAAILQAVLLLRPHVPLYSTDALPVNCSAYSARPPSLDSSRRRANERQPRTCHPISFVSSFISIITFLVRPVHIFDFCDEPRDQWSPLRFHSSELVASERHYAPGEPGILPAYTRSSSSSPTSSLSPRSFLPGTPDAASPRSPSTASPALTSAYSTMPPQAPESPCPVPSPEFAEPLKPSPQPLRVGDLLYWHHLMRSGEIPGAIDDRRARGITAVLFDR